MCFPSTQIKNPHWAIIDENFVRCRENVRFGRCDAQEQPIRQNRVCMIESLLIVALSVILYEVIISSIIISQKHWFY